MITTYIFGHYVFWDTSAACYRYADTGDLCDPQQPDTMRPCPQCDRMPLADGRDPCFAEPIPNAFSACCGHGKYIGYILLKEETPSQETALLEAEATEVTVALDAWERREVRK